MKDLVLTALTREDLEAFFDHRLDLAFQRHFNHASQAGSEKGNVLTLDQFCEYTGIGKQTAYRLTSRGEVPHSKRGKRLYFDKAQVDAWLLANHTGGNVEADRKADDYLLRKRHRRA